MSLLPTAPRSIGGVLDDALRLYRRSLVACLPIAFVSAVVMAALSWSLALKTQTIALDAGPATSFPDILAQLQPPPGFWKVYFAMIVLSFVTYGVLFARIDGVARGEGSLGAAISIGLMRAPMALCVGILFTLMISAGLVLLLIPGIWLWGVFELAFVPVIVERAGVFKSFGISRRLVKGNWWRSVVTIFVAFVILIVLVVVVSVIAGIPAGIMSGVFGAAGEAGMTSFLLIQQIVTAVLNTFVMSFFPCILLAVYYDLKLRNEGGDLADRVGALKPAS